MLVWVPAIPAWLNSRRFAQSNGLVYDMGGYCSRYLVGSRGKGAVDSGGSNVGIRGVRRARLWL